MSKIIIIGIIAFIVVVIIVVVLIVVLRKKKKSCSSSCAPNQECGTDACGNSCGNCPTGDTCVNGTCMPPGSTGYTCTTTGCSQDCVPAKSLSESFESADPTCYNTLSSCQQSCTTAPCSPQYPNGMCPQFSKCVNGECQYDNCPYSESVLPVPQGLSSGTYTISNGNNYLFALSGGQGVNPMVILTSPTTPQQLPSWTYSSQNLSLVSVPSSFYGTTQCTLQAHDECWGTNCGNPQDSVCTQPSETPSGVIYCTTFPNRPNRMILGSDFIFSVDAKAYIVPDTRPSAFGNTCGSCQQGYNKTGNIAFLTYSLDEENSHVWTVKSA